MTGIDLPEELEQRIELEQDRGESKQAAVRRLVLRGLEANSEMKRLRIGAMVASVAYLGGYAAAGTFGGSVVGGFYIMTLLVWTGFGRLPVAGWLRRLDLRRKWR